MNCDLKVFGLCKIRVVKSYLGLYMISRYGESMANERSIIGGGTRVSLVPTG